MVVKWLDAEIEWKMDKGFVGDFVSGYAEYRFGK